MPGAFVFTWLCFMTDACPPGPPLWVQPLASRNPRAFCCPGSQRTHPPASNPRHSLSQTLPLQGLLGHTSPRGWPLTAPGRGPGSLCSTHLNSAWSLKLSPRAGYKPLSGPKLSRNWKRRGSYTLSTVVAPSDPLPHVEQYEVVWPRRLPGARARRALPSHSGLYPDSVSYVLEARGHTFTLHLQKNRDLVGSGYAET